MSKQMEMLKVLDKCISSRLWYTSLNLSSINNDNNLKEFSHNCYIDLTELEVIVESLIHLPNEEQYQWITHILLQKLIKNKSSNIDFNVQHNMQTRVEYIQMRNAIKLCNNIPDYVYDKELLLSSYTQHSVSSVTSQEIITFLKKSILVYPRITCWIINNLSVFNIYKIIDDLQDVYFSTLKLCLEHIPVRINWYSTNEELKSCSLEDDLTICDKYLQIILCLLSKMDIGINAEIEFLKIVYPVLLKANNDKDIELALYSRKNRKLFRQWISLWNETYASPKDNTLHTVYKISENIFKLTKNFKVLLCKQGLLERITTGKLHWLNDILNICYFLTMNEKYSEVELLLSCDLLKKLYLVLLLKALNDFPQEEINSLEDCDNIFICGSIKFFLEKCFADLHDDYDLNKLYILKNHIGIIEYILHWKKNSFVTMKSKNKELKNIQSDASKQIISMKYILSLLQKCNVLSVLKVTTNIHDQDYSTIKNLLINSDESESFRAYCSIASALKAILLCESYSIEHEQVAKYLNNMMSYLSSLFPLSLRLETMENIFSLLFLRYDGDFNVTSINSNYDKSMEYEKSGFVPNKYAMRDTLHYLFESASVVLQEIEELQLEQMQQLRKNVFSFTSALLNARWRLQFYTKSDFIENVGIPQDETCSLSFTNKTELVISQKSNLSHRSKSNILFYKENTASDEIKIKSDSSSESSLLDGNSKGKKRSRNTLADPSTRKDRASLINLMLASKESLVLHCLWKRDLQKAQEVIEMYQMGNTPLDNELRFSEAFHIFKQDTFKYIRMLDVTDSLKKTSNTSTLENIRLAAQEGVQSSRHTNQLETFLASQESRLRTMHTDILNSNEILTLSALDLSLTLSQTHQISSNLCDVAMKYLKLCKTFDSTEHANFFLRVYQLFYESKSGMSVTALLCDVRIPLSIIKWKENNVFWNNFSDNYWAFNNTERAKIVEEQSCDNRFLSLKTLKNMCVIYSSDQKYFQNVYSHLQLVYTIIPDTNSDNFNIMTDLLKTPLHRYFGYQIFDLQMEPRKLETIAFNLQVNLIHSILVNVCPNISCYNKGNCIDVVDNGCIVLNQSRIREKSIVKDATIKGPNRCASEILTELLQILRDSYPKQSCLDSLCLKNISNCAVVQTVLSKTSNLAVLDLGELAVGDETLTFFLNVWNIMFLHASLTIWFNDPPYDSLRHTVSLRSVGYIIGDLGLVTLAALRSKLFGNFTNDFKFFTRVEELNELAWQDLDLVQNPKVIFAMANEFYGTPKICVYETQTLSESLENAVRDYFSYYSWKSVDDGWSSTEDGSTRQKIFLPDLARQYRDAFLQNVSATVANTNGNLFPIDKFEMSDQDVDVEYIAPYYTYEVMLTYCERDAPVNRNAANTVETLHWQTRKLKNDLLQYLQDHCWLLSYLLQRMYNENLTILKNSCDDVKRIECLENLLNSSWICRIKALFNDNQTLTAIRDNVTAHELCNYFKRGEEEYNWESFVEILNALTDSVARYNAELIRLKDLILSHVLSNPSVLPNAKLLQYLYQIKDIHILAQTILHNINKWSINVCERALLHALHHRYNYKLPAHCKQRINVILCKIIIFRKMIPYCASSKWNSTWYDIMYCTEKVDSFQIIESLIDADQFELCLEWLECQAFSLEIQPSVIQDFLTGVLRNEQRGFDQALKFLQALPSSQSVKVCKGILKKIESISALRFVSHYLLEHCKPTEKSKYRKILVGVDILKMLESKDRALYIHLMKEPLLMLEQLLMNCKFKSIQNILKALRKDLQQADVDIGSFDKVIRFYAKKSLDFRVSFQRDGAENKHVSQFSLDAKNNEFIMPVNVPTKEEWIPNDRARECSCCKTVIFSMFNRRHHCRRCGRVVCAVCSQHRMQVVGYPTSVLVRVCDDCKRQTVLQMQAVLDVPSTSGSETFDYWRLTRDEKHNRTIREEFSFEYAPNISLCLAILNLHSDHKMYASFLLDRCDEMKQLLQPVNGGKINPEIDHAVIIKMIRSLLVAGKVKCAKLGFNTGLAHCDRFLSQVDLIATLVQSDCLALIPTDDLDEHTLRKLRDLLTEKERWTLALDVSTKAGLDAQGVWAAWGKACLKVERFDQARDKFYYCLDKIVNEDFDDWVMLTYAKESTEEGKKEAIETTLLPKKESKATSDVEDEKASEDHHSRRNEFFKCRPLKDPPLLTEVIQILDNLSIHRFRTQQPSQFKSNTAQEILLDSLKAVSQNRFNIKNLTPVSQTVYYQESLYYLLTYGSYTSILQFFLKHNEFDKCLIYVLENDLERDLFLNSVYLYCLRNNDIKELHDAMKVKDSTLFIWWKYLMHICHFMERKQYWHILYQIQLFMKDHVRASITCIHFYTNEANTYSDLYDRVHLLQDAQKHLELQIENSNKRRKSTHFVHSGQTALVMEPSEIDRHINTICRQTEIVKFLANCEREERPTTEFLNFFPDNDSSQTLRLPTLFGTRQEKIHLAVLAILCGRDIEEGFGIAFRIIQDYNLSQQKVYSLAGHVLALKNNTIAIEQLIKCCRSSGMPNAHIISDHILTHCVKLLLNSSYSEQNPAIKNHIDSLVRLITDTELRINAYIESKQLKAAYLLAVKYSRASDIRRILKESDRLGQSAIKAICLKWLKQELKE